MESMMRYMIALAAILSAFAMAAPAASATGTSKYCLKGPGATMNCTYQTIASCNSAKKGTESCVANPASTTGSGSGMSKSTTSTMKK
jgi:Protein of unknown function (DUF3551)